jgi:hypothetical protein
MVYHDDEWNFSMCRTESISVGGGTSAKFRCDCSVPGYIGVGMVIGDVYVNNSVKVLFHHVQNVTFRIDASYDEHVLGAEKDFIGEIRKQIANVLNTGEVNIRQLTVKNGSIIVFFRLVGSQIDEVELLAESYKEFEKLVKSGKFTLNDAKGKVMRIPSQTVQSEDDVDKSNHEKDPIFKDDTSKGVMIGLGAGLCGVLIVIIGLIICICVKNRNQEKAVTPLNVATPAAPIVMQPTYRNLEYADRLEHSKPYTRQV